MKKKMTKDEIINRLANVSTRRDVIDACKMVNYLVGYLEGIITVTPEGEKISPEQIMEAIVFSAEKSAKISSN
jgi:hypothetical protein